MAETKQTTRDRLLAMLLARQGEDVSGEEAARELCCTRTAVWKAIKALKEDGYEIEAVRKRGYRLIRESRRFQPEALRRYLENPDVQIVLYDTVSSTNRAAKELAADKRAGHGSFVIARQQTEGRGRKGKSFFSPKDAGLYMSVVLYPRHSLEESLKMTAVAAVAVYRAVRKVCGIRLGIKWVNDLYLEDKKVCGILTEAVTDIESGQIQFAVIGIGLNLYPPEGGYPGELSGTASALCPSEAEMGFDPNRLAAEIVNELLRSVADLQIPEEYREASIVLGRTITVCGPGEDRKQVRAVEILEDGRLVVEDQEKNRTALRFGEVTTAAAGR